MRLIIPPPPARFAVPLVLLTLAGPSIGQAQELHGKFLEAGSGDPVEGALVRLIDDSDSTRATAVTNVEGAARVEADASGSFRVVIERIGFERWRSEPFELATGAVARRTFRITVRPVELGGLAVDVEDDRRCRVDPTTGRATARLWEEIRKALERERLTRAEGRVTYRAREYRRVLDGQLRISSEEASTTTSVARSPYRAVSVEALDSEGFVGRDATGGWLYRAPDADVLLSSRFQQTHCFGIAEDEGEGRIGLTFRPIDGRHVPEIEGTLWVDAGTAELQEVRFHYTNLGLPVEDSEARGQVTFRRAPTGDWYVERWWIRWPRRVEEGQLREQEVDERGVRRVRRDRSVIEYGEVGASVTSLVASGDDAAPAPRRVAVGRGTVRGTVFDSLAGAPASGVEVELRGTGRRTRTDAQGSFVFLSVPEGRYGVTFVHPAVPGLPDSLTATTVNVQANWTAEASLAAPGPNRLHRMVCGDEPGGLVAGRVLIAGDDEPVPAARVWFDWRDEAVTASSGGGAVGAAMAEASHRATMETDSTGRFLACGVALERDVVVEAPGVADTIVLSNERPAATLALRTDPDAAARLAARGGEGGGTELVGSVRASGSGEPLPGARIELIDAERTITTGDEGRFRVSDLPAGENRIVVEHLGYRTDTVAVVLDEATTTLVELTAPAEPVELAGLEVTVERTVRDRRLRGFYGRMEAGLGRFASKEDVQQNGVIGSLRRLPNIQVRPCYWITSPDTAEGMPGQALPTADCYQLVSANRGYGFGTRGSRQTGQQCVPVIYLDGVRIGGGGEGPSGSALEVILSLSPDEIEGIEIHEPGTAPPQFGGTGSGCGVMLVWTSR